MLYIKTFESEMTSQGTLSQDDVDIISDIFLEFKEKWKLSSDRFADNKITIIRYDKFFINVDISHEHFMKGIYMTPEKEEEVRNNRDYYSSFDMELDIIINKLKKFDYQVLSAFYNRNGKINHHISISHTEEKSKEIKGIKEFVEIKDYKTWIRYHNDDSYSKIGDYFKNFTNHDKNYNRIYFDLLVDTDNFEIKVPDEISDFMRWYEYPILDYEKGICQDKDGRQIRIGRLLNRLGEDKLLQTYNNSKQNMLKNINDLQVVISRHPYDIIGMSTNRGWTTCHDINDTRYKGEHLSGIRGHLHRGSLIAYLIRKSDRNIENPISRCIISNYSNKLYVDRHIYGTNIKEFKEFLEDWVIEYNKNAK